MALYGDSTPEGIAQRLRVLWRAAYPHLKQGAFADEIGLTDSQLSNYFAVGENQRRMSIDTAITIAMRSQVTLDWLYLGNPAGLPLELAQKLLREPESAEPKRQAKASRAR